MTGAMTREGGRKGERLLEWEYGLEEKVCLVPSPVPRPTLPLCLALGNLITVKAAADSQV